MKKLLLLALLISGMANAQKGQANTERGGDYGEDWIEVSYFNFNGGQYASARSEDIGAGCYVNLPSDPTSFASLHKASDTLIIETTDMATTTFNIVGSSFASAFDRTTNYLYKRTEDGQYRGAPAADALSLNLDQDCAIAGFVNQQAPNGIGIGSVNYDDYTAVHFRHYSRHTGYTDVANGTTNLPNVNVGERAQFNLTLPSNVTHLILTQGGVRIPSHDQYSGVDLTASSGSKIILFDIIERVGNNFIAEAIWTNFSGRFNSGNGVYVGAYNSNEDTDGDGVIDYNDAFPNDPTEVLDSDNDGIGDNADLLPRVHNRQAYVHHITSTFPSTENRPSHAELCNVASLGDIISQYQGNTYIAGHHGTVGENLWVGARNSDTVIYGSVSHTMDPSGNPQTIINTTWTNSSGDVITVNGPAATFTLCLE